MITDTSAQDTRLGSGQRTSRRRNWLVFSALVATLLSAGLYGLGGRLNADHVASLSDLNVAPVTRADFRREITAQGRIVAANSPAVFSPEVGFVTLNVRAGDAVTKGQQLASVRSPQLLELLEQQEAELASMTTALQRQKIQARRSKLELEQLEALAKVNLQAMEREKRRADAAYAQQLISELDHKQALDELERAQLEYQQAQQNASLENEALDFEVSAAAKQVERQQLLVTGLQRRVGELNIHSPVTGKVGSVQVDNKQAVALNQEIMTVVDLTAYEVDAAVAEGAADELVPGMPARVSYGGETFAAQVAAISPQVVGNQIQVRLQFADERPAGLRQNQRVVTRIALQNVKDALTLPRGSFVDNYPGYVYVVEGNRANRREVLLGEHSIETVQVLSGLQAGEQVITSRLNVHENTNHIYLAN